MECFQNIVYVCIANTPIMELMNIIAINAKTLNHGTSINEIVAKQKYI